MRYAMYYTCFYDSPLGQIGLACSDQALVALWLPGQPVFDREALSLPDHPILAATRQWLRRYFAGQAPDWGELPLAPEGSAFRQLVWGLLRQIPYGESTTYGALAQEAARLLGKEKMSAQAIGGAVGANPISIIIPCHRCLGAGGALTGYAGGLELKRKLLTLEGIGFIDKNSP